MMTWATGKYSAPPALITMVWRCDNSVALYSIIIVRIFVQNCRRFLQHTLAASKANEPFFFFHLQHRSRQRDSSTAKDNGIPFWAKLPREERFRVDPSVLVFTSNEIWIVLHVMCSWQSCFSFNANLENKILAASKVPQFTHPQCYTVIHHVRCANTMRSIAKLTLNGNYSVTFSIRIYICFHPLRSPFVRWNKNWNGKFKIIAQNDLKRKFRNYSIIEWPRKEGATYQSYRFVALLLTK